MKFWQILGTTLGILLFIAIIALLVATPISMEKNGCASWFETWQYWFDSLKNTNETATAFINAIRLN